MYVSGKQIAPGQTGHEAAWQLLQEQYLRHMGAPMPEVSHTHRGKPYFVGGGCHFSLTHTKKHVFCVLSDHPVGIDAEELDRQIRPELAQKILSPKEKAQYDAASDPRMALLKFWVLKEAWAKCTGEGLHGYPNDTEFTLDDPRLEERSGCIVAVIEEESYVI